MKKFKQFSTFKIEHKDEKFGGKDYEFSKPLIGYWHTGLNGDICLIYFIKNDTLYLCGIFSHDEAGIGQPPSQNKQKSLAAKLANQTFFEKKNVMPKKTFAEMLYEEKVIKGIMNSLTEEEFQSLINPKDEDFGPSQTVEEVTKELQEMIDKIED